MINLYNDEPITDDDLDNCGAEGHDLDIVEALRILCPEHRKIALQEAEARTRLQPDWDFWRAAVVAAGDVRRGVTPMLIHLQMLVDR